MTSLRFRDLSRRVYELRRHLLPAKFDPTGVSYSDRIYERVRGFRVLTHAEFESFLEDRAMTVINAAFAERRTSGRINPSLLALMAYREAAHPLPDSLAEAAAKRTKYPDLEARLEMAKRTYTHLLRERNHGIKERNILQVLLPLGFEESEFDPTWLDLTESWATGRGETAHRSAKVQVQIDPERELKTVKRILKGFRDLDESMNSK